MLYEVITKSRVGHRAELVPLLRDITVKRSRDEWLEGLQSVGVVEGRAVLDLDYVEDSAADVDMRNNFV